MTPMDRDDEILQALRQERFFTILFQAPVLALFAGASFFFFGFEVALITVLVVGFVMTAANIAVHTTKLFIELADIRKTVCRRA